jgi:hypothetical protein
MGWETMNWVHLAEDRDKWQAVVNGLSGFIRCWEFLDKLTSY